MEEQQPPSAGGDAETINLIKGDDRSQNEKNPIINGEHIADDEQTREKNEIKLKEAKSDDQEEESKDDNHRAEPRSSVEKSSLYQKGDKLLQTGQIDEALKCFLTSLKGLTESNTFHELPQCLHQISDIYFTKNEYEKAVYFIQAEKMYYETALIDILAFQHEVESNKKKQQEDGESNNGVQETGKEECDILQEDDVSSPEVAKANEFENLANLCLKEGKLQLAMEYCGKATKLFREAYGDEHPRTTRALDLFTCIYADVGKKLYKDAMQRFDEDKTEKLEGPDNLLKEASGLRLRHKKKVTFREEDVSEDQDPSVNRELEPTPPQEEDDWVVTCLLMVVFFLITILVSLIISYFYCRDNTRSNFCAELHGDMTYWYMKMKQFIHYYIKGNSK